MVSYQMLMAMREGILKSDYYHSLWLYSMTPMIIKWFFFYFPTENKTTIYEKQLQKKTFLICINYKLIKMTFNCLEISLYFLLVYWLIIILNCYENRTVCYDRQILLVS